MSEGGHQAVYEQASREMQAATFLGESLKSLCRKGPRVGQLRVSSLSFPVITTVAFMGYKELQLLIQRLSVGCLLCARHCAGCLGSSRDRAKPCRPGLIFQQKAVSQ